jgi:hypothetical protein
VTIEHVTTLSTCLGREEETGFTCRDCEPNMEGVIGSTTYCGNQRNRREVGPEDPNYRVYAYIATSVSLSFQVTETNVIRMNVLPTYRYGIEKARD